LIVKDLLLGGLKLGLQVVDGLQLVLYRLPLYSIFQLLVLNLLLCAPPLRPNLHEEATGASLLYNRMNDENQES
jgi:hypothetical protein